MQSALWLKDTVVLFDELRFCIMPLQECIGCIEKPDFVAEVLKLRAEEAAAKTEL